MTCIGAQEAVCVDLRAEQAANEESDGRDAAGLREALRRELAWLGPDRQQGIDSAMRAIEEWR